MAVTSGKKSSRFDFAGEVENVLKKNREGEEDKEVIESLAANQDFSKESRVVSGNSKNIPVPEPAVEKEDEVDQLLVTIKKESTGMQKTIYFDQDVYDYIQEKVNKNHVKFSKAVNLLFREYILKKNQ